MCVILYYSGLFHLSQLESSQRNTKDTIQYNDYILTDRPSQIQTLFSCYVIILTLIWPCYETVNKINIICADWSIQNVIFLFKKNESLSSLYLYNKCHIKDQGKETKGSQTMKISHQRQRQTNTKC